MGFVEEGVSYSTALIGRHLDPYLFGLRVFRMTRVACCPREGDARNFSGHDNM